MHIPILGVGATALRDYGEVIHTVSGSCLGVIFRKCPLRPKPLSYRASRNILLHACREAGLPAASSAELRAAYAYGLKSLGCSDHEVTAALGIARVRSIDRLLSRHAALNAQRRVRERLC